jgi:hypothetical protein
MKDLLIELLKTKEPVNLQLFAQLIKPLSSKEIWDILWEANVTIETSRGRYGKLPVIYKIYSNLGVFKNKEFISVDGNQFARPTKYFKKMVIKTLESLNQ